MPYDLFISYSRRDNEQKRITGFVERIGRDFESLVGRPLRPFFDITETQGMDDWRHRILQGLRESRLLLAFVSPNYLQSEYCEWEFNEYVKNEVARALVGEGVAPIYLVEVPGWQDKDFDQHSAEWIAELRRRQHFDLRPWLHEGEESLREAEVESSIEQLSQRIAERIQRGERFEQSLGNVDAHNAHFIGRTRELRRLQETVALKKIGVLTAVHGVGGMGKTALAIEYAHAFAHEYGGGRWQVRCEGREDLVAAITTLAPALGIEFTDAEKIDTELQFQRILAELRRLADAREPHRCLLILDNVDRPALLEPAQTQRLPAADGLHVIATTRLGENDLFARHQDRAFVAVDEMPETDALDLIESYQPGGRLSRVAEREAAQEIVRLLGCFTLAVETAAVFLGQLAGDVTCADFLERLKQEGLEGLESAAAETSEGVRHGEKLLTATMQPTLERLSESERLALSYAALLPADQVALPWIRTLVAERYPELGQDTEPGHPDPWQNVVRRLIGLRLCRVTGVIDVDGQPLVARMHRLLQDVVLNVGEHTENIEAALLAHVRSRAGFLCEGWVQHEHRWELRPLTACAWQWIERGSPVGTYISNEVFGPLYRLGNFAEAETLVRRSMAIDGRSFGVDHPVVARDLNNLAQLLQGTNRLAEAEAVMRWALSIDEQAFGPDHPGVATDLNNLATLLNATNRLAEAEPLMRRALAIDEESYGPEHPNVAISLNNLAQLLGATNRLAEAERLIRRVVEIFEKSLGENHPNVASALNNLTELLQATNRRAEAETLMRRALAIDEQSFGPDHHDVARDINNLAILLQDTNRLAEAEPLMRRVVEIFEKRLGKDHPNVATAVNNLAQLLETTNRLTEAEPLMRRALAIDEQSFGPDHPNVAIRLNNLAQLLHDTTRFEAAEPLMRRAAQIFESSFGADHPNVASVLSNLAQLLRATNRLTEAEPLMRRVVEIFEKSLGNNHPNVASALNNLASLLQATNRLAEAEPLMRRALEINERSFVSDHPKVAIDLNNLAQLLKDTDRLTEAVPLMRRAVDVLLRFTASTGHEHAHLRALIANYQATLQRMGYSETQVVAELDKIGSPFGIKLGPDT